MSLYRDRLDLCVAGDKDSVIKEVEEKIHGWTGEDQEKGAVYLKLMQKTKEKVIGVRHGCSSCDIDVTGQ